MIDSSLLGKVLASLNEKLLRDGLEQVHLLIGGAGALIGAYQYVDSTTDVDAISLNGSLTDIERQALEVAKEFNLPPDWMNPHYSTYTIYLPQDYRNRCIRFFSGEALVADALGGEDLLIMKFMAGRKKDRSHILFLLKQDLDLSVVEERLIELKNIYPKLAESALDLYDSMVND